MQQGRLVPLARGGEGVERRVDHHRHADPRVGEQLGHLRELAVDAGIRVPYRAAQPATRTFAGRSSPCLCRRRGGVDADADADPDAGGGRFTLLSALRMTIALRSRSASGMTSHGTAAIASSAQLTHSVGSVSKQCPLVQCGDQALREQRLAEPRRSPARVRRISVQGVERTSFFSAPIAFECAAWRTREGGLCARRLGRNTAPARRP